MSKVWFTNDMIGVLLIGAGAPCLWSASVSLAVGTGMARFLIFKIFIQRMIRGSTIAKIVGANVKGLDWVEKEVRLWVFEELINGRKLSEIINTDHENIKYKA